jgi:dihydrofolate synthase/folylpolyglutamate synthase
MLEVLEKEGILNDWACLAGLANVRWPARMEYVHGKPSWLLDVAHNEEAFIAFLTTLDDIVPFDDRVLVYGAAADKNYQALLGFLPVMAREIWVIGGYYRAEKASIIAGETPAKVCLLRF